MIAAPALSLTRQLFLTMPLKTPAKASRYGWQVSLGCHRARLQKSAAKVSINFVAMPQKMTQTLQFTER